MLALRFKKPVRLSVVVIAAFTTLATTTGCTATAMNGVGEGKSDSKACLSFVAAFDGFNVAELADNFETQALELAAMIKQNILPFAEEEVAEESETFIGAVESYDSKNPLSAAGALVKAPSSLTALSSYCVNKTIDEVGKEACIA